MRKETLEEAAERIYPINIVSSDGYDGNFLCRIGFYIGYELAQERSYSEEEVKNIVNKTVDKFCTFFSDDLKQKVAKDWFEQFKKKNDYDAK